MSNPLTREKILEIIAEEKQKLQDDQCNNKKHPLGKQANLIGKGNRLDPMPAEQLLKGYRLD